MDYEPEDFARELLRHLEQDRAGDAEEFARKCNLAVRDVDSKKFEGALVRATGGSKGIIAVKRDIREPGRRRFTIAHEVGHFILPGHGLDECYCKSSFIESWRKDAVRQQEYDANRFASEVLVPRQLLHPMVAATSLTIEKIKGFAREFDASLTATSVKCIEVTEERCALVYVEGGRIKWVRRGENFHHFIPNGKIDPSTFAGKLFANSDERELSGETYLGRWTDSDQIEGDARCWEEAISLPYYDAIISIITY